MVSCTVGEENLIVKCTECGNTFRIDIPSDGDIVACPVCEADFKAVVKNGNVQMKEFVYEDDDDGELLARGENGCR
jgi:DNA-directed RNA polymerase subunit RPC12/RpoP